MGSAPALWAGPYTTTLLVIVDLVKGVGRAPPPSRGLAHIYAQISQPKCPRFAINVNHIDFTLLKMRSQCCHLHSRGSKWETCWSWNAHIKWSNCVYSVKVQYDWHMWEFLHISIQWSWGFCYKLTLLSCPLSKVMRSPREFKETVYTLPPRARKTIPSFQGFLYLGGKGGEVEGNEERSISCSVTEIKC